MPGRFSTGVQDIGVGAARVVAVTRSENLPGIFLELRGIRDAPHASDMDTRLRIALSIDRHGGRQPPEQATHGVDTRASYSGTPAVAPQPVVIRMVRHRARCVHARRELRAMDRGAQHRLKAGSTHLDLPAGEAFPFHASLASGHCADQHARSVPDARAVPI
jgi:hypothetical protein